MCNPMHKTCVAAAYKHYELMFIQQHWITMFYHAYFTTRKLLQNGNTPFA